MLIDGLLNERERALATIAAATTATVVEEEEEKVHNTREHSLTVFSKRAQTLNETILVHKYDKVMWFRGVANIESFRSLVVYSLFLALETNEYYN